MGALSLLGFLASIASAPQAVRDTLGGVPVLGAPIAWAVVVALALLFGYLAIATAPLRPLASEDHGRPDAADRDAALGPQITSLSDAMRTLESENAGLKRRIADLMPPENPVGWEDLTEDQKRALERMYNEGPVSKRHLDPDTRFYERHGFIERVAIINPGHTASFRLTEKSLPRARGEP